LSLMKESTIARLTICVFQIACFLDWVVIGLWVLGLWPLVLGVL
jgi:hypothetical protein